MQVNDEPKSATSKQKGLRTILSERHDFRPSTAAKKINVLCEYCATNRAPNPSEDYCCHSGRLSKHEDFQNQAEWLQESCNEHENVHIMFFAKFHCELNFIERVWGYAKSTLRSQCTFSFPDLKERLPQVLDSIPTHFYRKVARSCFRWMDGYRKGLTGLLLAYAMKKYKGHRTISEALDAEFDEAARGELMQCWQLECARKTTIKCK